MSNRVATPENRKGGALVHARNASLGTRRHPKAWRWLPLAGASLLCVWSFCPSAWGGDFPLHVFQPESNGVIEFSTPSNNVGCFYGTVEHDIELTCDRSQPTYLRFVLPPRGAATLIKNPGEQPCCSGDPLPYGESWKGGPFECDSMAAELRCTSESGHGFSISRKNVEVH